MALFCNLNPILQFFWILAIPFSIIFFLQQFNYVNFNSNNIKIKKNSFKNLINFLTSFSWSGIAFYSIFSNIFLVIILPTLFGIGFMGILFNPKKIIKVI